MNILDLDDWDVVQRHLWRPLPGDDVGRYEAGEQGRVGLLLKGYREGGMGMNGTWQPDAMRVWRAMDNLAAEARPREPADLPSIPPLASYTVDIVVTEAREGKPLPPDEEPRP